MQRQPPVGKMQPALLAKFKHLIRNRPVQPTIKVRPMQQAHFVVSCTSVAKSFQRVVKRGAFDRKISGDDTVILLIAFANNAQGYRKRPGLEIGRASCRERSAGLGGSRRLK